MELKFDNIDIDDYIDFLKSKGITYETNPKEYVEALHSALNEYFEFLDRIMWDIEHVKSNDKYNGDREAIPFYMIRQDIANLMEGLEML